MGVEVGSVAHDFTCRAVNNSGEIVDNFNLFKEIDGCYAVLFFYPLDFTFVCPTEMIALNKRMEAFKKNQC
jgi:peroxiredoxin (alkyl hydroperoxide reductase subunit C)